MILSYAPSPGGLPFPRLSYDDAFDAAAGINLPLAHRATSNVYDATEAGLRLLRLFAL